MLFRLLILLSLMRPDHALASGDCKIDAEAVIGFLEFEITGCSLKGTLTEGGNHLSGEWYVDLSNLDTGLDLRNKHMKELIEIEKYPKAKIRLEPVPIGGDKFKAHLTLHGVTLPVSGKVIKSSKKELKVSLELNTLSFGIEKAGYKGITIGEKLKVYAHVSK